jgi:hypothetical protein
VNKNKRKQATDMTMENKNCIDSMTIYLVAVRMPSDLYAVEVKELLLYISDRKKIIKELL